jgi:hypothetical protein
MAGVAVIGFVVGTHAGTSTLISTAVLAGFPSHCSSSGRLEYDRVLDRITRRNDTCP